LEEKDRYDDRRTEIERNHQKVEDESKILTVTCRNMRKRFLTWSFGP